MEKTDQTFDVALGARLRAQRMLSGISQKRFATELGVSFQQLQKYESGENRMSASKVYLAAATLKVSVGILMGEPPRAQEDALEAAVGVPGTNQLFDAWRRIQTERDRGILLTLARKLAAPIKV